MLLLLLSFRTSNAFELIYSLSTIDYVVYSLVSLILVLLGGLMSGLTVGLLSIDEMDLEIILAKGNPGEVKQAKKILSVISNHHLLLVTLLLANAGCMETLPLMLNKMLSEFLAVIISVTFVLVFGEVIPQALCTGPNQLKIASNLCLTVRLIMIIFFPISYPIAKLLDLIFGHHEKSRKLRNEDLKTLMTLHHSFARRSLETHSGLLSGQINIIIGTIDLRQKTVKECMIPIEKIFSMSDQTILDRKTLKAAVKKGYSRVPVFGDGDPEKILGILLVKRLVLVEEGEKLINSGIELREPVYVNEDTPMLELLTKLKGGKSHMAIVRNQTKTTGIITLEDVFEQILKSEIRDEDDYDFEIGKSVLSMRSRKKVKRPAGFKKPYSALHPFIQSADYIRLE